MREDITSKEVRQLYYKEKLAVYKIAKKLKCSEDTILLRLNKDVKRKTRYYDGRNYIRIYMPSHSRADKDGLVYEHIVLAEKALGKPLPLGTGVHHLGANDDNAQIIIYQNQAYHRLLHARARILENRKLGGKICRKCRVRKPFDEFWKHKRNSDGLGSYCKECFKYYYQVVKPKLKGEGI